MGASGDGSCVSAGRPYQSFQLASAHSQLSFAFASLPCPALCLCSAAPSFFIYIFEALVLFYFFSRSPKSHHPPTRLRSSRCRFPPATSAEAPLGTINHPKSCAHPTLARYRLRRFQEGMACFGWCCPTCTLFACFHEIAAFMFSS